MIITQAQNNVTYIFLTGYSWQPVQQNVPYFGPAEMLFRRKLKYFLIELLIDDRYLLPVHDIDQVL